MNPAAPALRFKDKYGNAFPSWEKLKLNEIAKIYDGTHTTPTYTETGVPFYSVEHLTKGSFEHTKFISEEVFARENRRVKLERGDVLMTRIGDIGTSKHLDWNVRASFYVSLALIKLQQDRLSPEFVHQSISANNFQRELWQRTIHVAFPKKINLGEIGECRLSLPTLEEQAKLADFLAAVDERIQQLNQKKALLDEYKKGVMDQLFTQAIRFKDDQGNDFPDWEEKKLGEVSVFINGRAYNQDELLTKGVYPVLRVGNFFTNPKWYYSNLELPADKYCDTGDLLYAWSASFGPRIWDGGKVIYHYHIWKVVPSQRITKLFLFHLLDWDVERIKNAQGNGIAMMHITKGAMEERPFRLPATDEQIKIAAFLSAIDNKIDSVSAQISETQVFKRGLLQQMFV
jgi:type I restriction enzyme, S subunit